MGGAKENKFLSWAFPGDEISRRWNDAAISENEEEFFNFFARSFSEFLSVVDLLQSSRSAVHSGEKRLKRSEAEEGEEDFLSNTELSAEKGSFQITYVDNEVEICKRANSFISRARSYLQKAEAKLTKGSRSCNRIIDESLILRYF